MPKNKRATKDIFGNKVWVTKKGKIIYTNWKRQALAAASLYPDLRKKGK